MTNGESGHESVISRTGSDGRLLYCWAPMRLHPFLSGVLALSLAAQVAGLEPAAQEAQFISGARQLIYEGKRSGEGYFDNAGETLIFQSEREENNPFYQIYLLDLRSGESARVSPGLGKTTCGFFQPGTNRLLFASTHHDPAASSKQQEEIGFRASGKQRRYAWDYDPSFDIFSAKRDGSGLVRLTQAQGYDAEAAYSPDGRQIVFSSTRTAYPTENLSPDDKARLEKDPAYFGEIYIMNADGSEPRRLTTAPGYDGGPFFSPDGEWIIWRRFDAQGMNADVHTMKKDGSDVQRVTDFQSMSWAPFYHPSGKYIIFTSNKFGFENFELFIVEASGERQPVRVTFTDGFDGLPVFSPDGKRLCWTSNRTADKKSQLHIADWNHQAALAAVGKSAGRKDVLQSRTSGAPAGEAPRPATTTFAPEIRANDLRAQVEWLAAPEREGRMTGSRGAATAAEWIADQLSDHGLRPLGESFFHPFEFHAGVKTIDEQNELRVNGRAYELRTDYQPISFSESGEVEGNVVFAGYGLSVPEGGGPRYNSYDDIDVKDRIVLVLRYVPEAVDAPRRAQLNRYAGLRYKAMLARERGAKAVLFVTGPNSPQAGKLIPHSGDETVAGSGIVAHSISGAVADAVLATSGKTLAALQSALDTENPHAEGAFLVPNMQVKIRAGIERVKKTDRNVVAYLPPSEGAPKPVKPDRSAASNSGDSSTSPARQAGSESERSDAASAVDSLDEYVVVGAHYDHLGSGSTSSSMARSGEETKTHPGADDNASGTAAVIELAASLAHERKLHPEKFRRGIIFALWSGEEIGIIGSAAFCEKPPVPRESLAAYVNFDMIGRLRENKLTLQAVGSSKVWRRLIEKRNVAAGFNLVLNDDPYLPTDVTSFYPKRVPVLNFFTGAHEDYHRPTDTAEKLDYEGTARIARFAQGIILDVVSAAERPDLARVERSDRGGGSRETLRAYLGTIPDYTTEVRGVKLSGVRGGSPAEKGGIRSGDVLVEFAGQKITNIYDYTYALDAVKIGQAVKMVVERNGQRVELSVVPEARK